MALRSKLPTARALIGFCFCGFQAILASACAIYSSQTSTGSTVNDVAARSSGAFYDLHQAVGFFEAYKGGHCVSGMGKANDFLSIARINLSKNPDGDLALVAGQIENLSGLRESAQIVDIERVREQLHAIAAAKGYRHDDSWNDNFLKCKDAHLDAAVSN